MCWDQKWRKELSRLRFLKRFLPYRADAFDELLFEASGRLHGEFEIQSGFCGCFGRAGVRDAKHAARAGKRGFYGFGYGLGSRMKP